MTTDAAYGEQERALLARAAAAPWDAAVVLSLGRLQAGILKYPEAADSLRRAIVLNPDDPQAWLAYATLAVHLHEGEQSTDNAYQRAAKAAGADPSVLMAVIEHFGKDEKPALALQYIEQAFNANMQLPKNQVRYLSSLVALGRSGDAINACRSLIAQYTDLAAKHEGLQREQLLLHRAFLLQAAGLDTEIDACLADCARLFGAVPVQFDGQPGLLPDSAARVSRLQAQLRGRDIFVFLPGPSAKTFTANARSFADWDFVPVSIAVHVDAVEKSMLRDIGRHLELIWMSNPAHLRIAEEAIVRTLERGPGIRLISQGYSFLDYPRVNEFISRYNDKMLWVNPLSLPPSPSAPLQFLVGNSLSVLLQVLIWGQPERIFLIGADGGAAAPDAASSVYFDTPDPAREPGLAELGETGRQPEAVKWNPLSAADAARRFRLEAKEVDEMVTIVNRIFRVVFGLRVPRIINCSPYSAHTAFEKVTIQEALAMKP